MNWKGFVMKRSWPNFKVLPRHLPGGTGENQENPQSGQPVSGPRSETGTSRIRSRSVDHSATTSI
jgi:hypothetical protein